MGQVYCSMQGAVLSASKMRAQAFCKGPGFQRSQRIWKTGPFKDKLHRQAAFGRFEGVHVEVSESGNWYLSIFLPGSFHRSPEWLGLEGTLKNISFQPSAMDTDTFHQIWLLQAPSSMALNISKGGWWSIWRGSLMRTGWGHLVQTCLNNLTQGTAASTFLPS